MLVRIADIGSVSCPTFYRLGFADHKLVLVSLCLGDRLSMAGYWKFNTFLLEIWSYRGWLENMIQKVLVGRLLEIGGGDPLSIDFTIEFCSPQIGQRRRSF